MYNIYIYICWFILNMKNAGVCDLERSPGKEEGWGLGVRYARGPIRGDPVALYRAMTTGTTTTTLDTHPSKEKRGPNNDP